MQPSPGLLAGVRAQRDDALAALVRALPLAHPTQVLEMSHDPADRR